MTLTSIKGKTKRMFQDPVVPVISSFTSSSMTNSITVVANAFSNTLKVLPQKCGQLLQCNSYIHIFFHQKNINVFAIFQDRNFNVKLGNTFVKF